MRELSVIERVWLSLSDRPRKAAEVAELVQCSRGVASKCLQVLRYSGHAATTGGSHNAAWVRVAGKPYHPGEPWNDPRSRANLIRRKSAREVPALDWRNLLRGLDA